MHEAFLHFIWSLQYFNRTSLTTTDGELIEVLSPGTLNVHSGADFSNAKIRIGGMAWAGSVEIHTKASFWYDHRHDQDPAYEQVILHVVWEQDKEVYRSDKSLLPALELKNRVDKKLILDYKKLLNNPFAIPCKKSFYRVDDLIKLNMVERALVQRLESKADIIIRMLAQNNGDWQETVYQVLARNFGFKVNSDPFFALAKSLPFKILLKHANHPAQIEALLFGQAGLLDVSVGDEYYKLLQREYRILTAKYSLVAGKLKRTQWRFLRLRPANFPTVRLAQFAALVAHRENIFSEILVPQNFHELKGFFLIFQSEYWRSHYRFNVATKKRVADFGDSSVENVLINSVAPLLVAYGKYTDRQEVVDYAIEVLRHVQAESNSITKLWNELGYTVRSAFDSQGLIELYNHYCQQRNCLNCAIGCFLLKPKS